jgi:hemolysin activation/secretion protein
VQLREGILPIEVVEATVSEITVTSYDTERNKVEKGILRSSLIEAWSPVKVGKVVKKKKLDDFVNLLNLSPDRFVSAVISRGAEPNTLSLGYEVYEANPWHFYVQVDNSGTKERQWAPRVGLINTNLLGMDDRMTLLYQGPWESGIEDNYLLFGNYGFPVFTPRLRLNLYAGRSEFDVSDDFGIDFLGRGTFYGGILSYNLFQADNWFVDIISSLSHERSEVTPTLGITSDVEMDLWSIGIDAHRSGDMSNSSVTFNRVMSIDGSSRNDFQQARLNTEPDFAIYTGSVAYSQYLDPNKVHRLSGSGRYITSDERLVPSKMTTFGGLHTVRGYKEDEIVADGGILLSAQYEFDLVKYNASKDNIETGTEKKQDEKAWLKKLAPLVFFDYGRARIKNAVPGEKGIRELTSLGIGMIFDVGDNFSSAIYYGLPLRSTDDTDKGQGRCNFSFILRW